MTEEQQQYYSKVRRTAFLNVVFRLSRIIASFYMFLTILLDHQDLRLLIAKIMICVGTIGLADRIVKD